MVMTVNGSGGAIFGLYAAGRTAIPEAMKKPLLAIVAAGVWITASEFIRNEILFKHYWVDHFAGLGLKFATLPVNGLLWTLWSLLLAGLIAKLLTKFTFLETIAYAWLAGFPLMWISLFNLQVLPHGLLLIAVPLSLLEVFIAAVIVNKLQGDTSGEE